MTYTVSSGTLDLTQPNPTLVNASMLPYCCTVSDFFRFIVISFVLQCRVILTLWLLQYFFDASEAEAWMSEQELYMISEDRARDEMGATNMLKKHGNMERVVEDYADTIRQLGERSRKFLDEGHPDRWVDLGNLLVTIVMFMFTLYVNCTRGYTKIITMMLNISQVKLIATLWLKDHIANNKNNTLEHDTNHEVVPEWYDIHVRVYSDAHKLTSSQLSLPRDIKTEY